MYDPGISTSSIYVHWPFCPYRCHFCDFVTVTGHNEFMAHYHQALMREIKLFQEQSQLAKTSHNFNTIYLGGGTPSTYPTPLLLDMTGTLKELGVWSPTIEVTIEVNPGTVQQEQLIEWRNMGINRLSIGVQGLKERALRDLNRQQATHDVYNLLAWAAPVFDNISIDLIIGLPGVTPDEWRAMITEIIGWNITHISVYFLTVHEYTPLAYRLSKGQVTLPCDDETVALWYWTREQLEKAGFIQYELSNYARKGFEGRHSHAYWNRDPYRGFGLGAWSFDGTRRMHNEKKLREYCSAVEQEQFVVWHETIDARGIWLERVMLGLRKMQGLSYDQLMQDLPVVHHDELLHRIEQLRNAQLLAEDAEGYLHVTPRGLAVTNDIIVHLTP